MDNDPKHKLKISLRLGIELAPLPMVRTKIIIKKPRENGAGTPIVLHL